MVMAAGGAGEVERVQAKAVAVMEEEEEAWETVMVGMRGPWRSEGPRGEGAQSDSPWAPL